jgi:hypothetical protein
MDTELYKELTAYADELYFDLRKRDDEGEFYGNRLERPRNRYNAFEAALTKLAQRIGDGHPITDAPLIANLYHIIARFIQGRVSAAHQNKEGALADWDTATETEIVCETSDATYAQASTEHKEMGFSIAANIVLAINPQDYSYDEPRRVHGREVVIVSLVK